MPGHSEPVLTFGSLFSGIGGIDLGLQRAGMVCKWQVEIDPFARRVLAKHWPNVRRFEDVRECGASNLEAVDLIAGGFPCQDISIAGKGAGIDGERSGLWREFARIIRELRPRYVLVENVAALLGRGIDRVLGDLAESGYDAEWQVLPAAAFGASHIRERLFLVAYSDSERQQEQRRPSSAQADGARVFANLEHGSEWPAEPRVGRVAHGIPARIHGGRVNDELGSKEGGTARRQDDQVRAVRGDGKTTETSPRSEQADGSYCAVSEMPCSPAYSARDMGAGQTQNMDLRGLRQGVQQAGLACSQDMWPPVPEYLRSATGHETMECRQWDEEPNIPRVATGVPNRANRLRCLGNAVVPQVAQFVGERILECEEAVSDARTF